MKDSTRRTLRTAVWGVLAFLALLPGMLEVADVDTSALPWLAGIVATTTAITRVMAAPQVEAFLQTYVPWLAKTRPDGAHELGRDEDAPADAGTVRGWLVIGVMALLVIASMVFVAMLAGSAAPADAHMRPVEHVAVNRVTDCRGVLAVAFSLEVLHGREWTFRQDDGAAVVEVHHLGAAAGPGGHWEAYPATSGGEGHLRVDTAAGLPFWDAVRVRHSGWTSSPAVAVECPA